MSMPHIPLWHMPPPHMPMPQSAAGSDCLPAADRAAKVEYCVVRCASPHEGQRNSAASALRRTSFSNFVPQSSQAYSKIGIFSKMP